MFDEPVVDQNIEGNDNAQVQGSGSAYVNKVNVYVNSPPLTKSVALQGIEQSAIPGTLPPVWNVPYQRAPIFIGREDVLEQLHTSFQEGQAVIGLNGLGGIGKTLTAVEYAYRYGLDYQTVLWVTADENFTSDLVTIAQMLDLPGKDVSEQNVVIHAVRRWLAQNTKWLLILDNVEDVSLIRQFTPLAQQGHLLFTTLTQVFGQVAYPIEIEKMRSEEGASFLLRRLHIAKPFESQATVSKHPLFDQAQDIAQAVDGLPLALEQAGAYIEENSCGLGEYLALYQQKRDTLLNYRSELGLEEQKTVTTTWALSVEKIEKANREAGELLRFCAFLSPDAIRKDIIIAGASELGPLLSSLREHPEQFNEAIKILRKYSLVRSNADFTALTIHRLVQAVLKDRMSEEVQHQWAERTVRAINQIFPASTVDTWSRCEQCLPHAQICIAHINQWEIISAEAACLLHAIGRYLYDRGHYAEAEASFHQGVSMREQLLGKEHVLTAECLNDLAESYRMQGKYRQAIPLCERALHIREQHFAEDNAEVATSLNNLGRLYHHLSAFGEAARFYQRALAIRQRIPGMAAADVVWSLNDLALCYREQGKYAEAFLLFQQAREITEKTPGLDQTLMATYLGNLASLYREQGRYAEAFLLYQQAREITEKTLGPDHPNMATYLNNLAGLYDEQGKYAEALLLFQQAREITEKTLGPDHPDMAIRLGNLAGLYREQGKYAEALLLFQQAREITEKTLGPDHPDMATYLNNLAGLYNEQGKYAEALLLVQQAREIIEKTLGPDHPVMATSLGNLAGLYREQGKYAEALPLEEQAREITEKTLGPDHPAMATSLGNLAAIYNEQGRYAEAFLLFQQAREITEKTLGPDHPAMAIRLGNLAAIYNEQGKYAEALLLFQQAREITEKTLGPDHPDMATYLGNLAGLYREQGKYTQAKQCYERALTIEEAIFGGKHPPIVNILGNFAILYLRQRNYAYAEPLYERALRICEQTQGFSSMRYLSILQRCARMLRAAKKQRKAANIEERIKNIQSKKPEENL